ncbi:nuclear transport factor 2 family protein [Pararhodonellum marinum]|uniref:nuclear transport factor 2 family protein n=1 Tax=Pararhodonellum marinum TaxID=2755358 RepID=UPI00188F1BB6|nr:nuclear transport factor 2 family protein [Pararhodonellum marinum]
MKDRENIIENYIAGYNNFDVSKMVTDFANDMVFQNIQSGTVTMTIEGIEAFKAQAETAKGFFSERKQTIKSFRHEGEKTEIDIDYFGVLATDLPNGMKKGQEIKLSGKSVFEFKDNNISKLTDIS